MTPKVSVIIPCFNASRWIRDTLESAYAQDGVAEIIVVDDGSVDDSAEVIERAFPAVRLVRTANQGASRARNTGTEACSGDFIQYLDADDLLAPGKIAFQVRLLEQTEMDAAYGDWQRLVADEKGTFVRGEIVARQMIGDPELALFGDFWCPPAAYLFRRAIVDRIGGWNEGLPVIQDARFALDCALHGGSFIYTPGIMAFYRQYGADSLSRRDATAFNRDVYRNASEVEIWWRSHGELSQKRTDALVNCYGYVARSTYERDPQTFESAYSDLQRLAPGYVPRSPRHLAMAASLVGYRNAEAAALLYRRTKRRLLKREHA